MLLASLLAISLLPPGGLVCCVHGDGSPKLELANGNGRCDPAQHDETGPAWSGSDGPSCHDIPLTSPGARGDGSRPPVPREPALPCSGCDASSQIAPAPPPSLPIPLHPLNDIRRC